MRTNLIENTGLGFLARNQLHNRQRIKVYVEDEDDVPFWKYFFEKAAIYDTSISPPETISSEGIKNGKAAVLQYANEANQAFLLCVDSDFDFLFKNESFPYQYINTNPFIFQTYLYAIENYKCYARCLHQVVVDTVLVDKHIFDFELFVQEYSEIVYEYFIKWLYFEKKHRQNTHQPHILPLKNTQTTGNSFCENIKLQNVKIEDNGRAALAFLRNTLGIKINELPSVATTELEKLKNEFALCGLTPQNTYLFLRGHNIYDDILKPILNRVADVLKNEQLALYSINAKHDTEAKNKRDKYKKQVFTSKNDEMTAIERSLLNHKYFDKCPFSAKILADLDTFENL